MSIVAGQLPGARVLDLFAGSGALGLEALSRGAAHAVFVESHPQSLAAIKANAAALGALPRSTILREDAERHAAKLPPFEYDVAFADPPYAGGFAARIAQRWLAAPFAGLLGVEHVLAEAMPAGGETRRYGDTAITLFRADR